ncbi:hypothetical protein I5Q34_18160 [Streptomyces sp. AV19]|uniref:hypothetical protein n=1 Tax=Streptomyces sp. AV19 TaxID=2793068 RepID=UPI0018FEEE7A|nr:hypothetical protein [Streptomyces sp. AV19]MBH1936172.1 hypothetical protein [Streptomyces sp. AV19]MDG4534640.1 hypothetical protein [Streptomyces sp. AV19]
MATTQDIRKAATDTAYAAAGLADLTAEKLGQVVADAPAKFEQLRRTDPKALGDRVTKGAKEAQDKVTAKVGEIVGTLDGDFKKFGQTVQDLALQGVGQAVGLAAKGGEAFDKLAERGREAVKTWNGEQPANEAAEIPVATEPQEQAAAEDAKAAEDVKATEDGKTAEDSKAEEDDKPAAKKAAPRRTTARKAEAKADDAS